MSAGVFDIDRLDRGATFCLGIHVEQCDGTPVDLTGYDSVEGSIKENYGDEESIVDFIGVISNPTLGYINIYIVAEDTLDLVEEKYYYDIILKSGDYVFRLLEGRVIVSPEITEA